MLTLLVAIFILTIGMIVMVNGYVFMGIALSGLGGIAVAICATLALLSHINVKHKYQKDYLEYEILQKQINSGKYNITTLTSEMILYNWKIMDNQRYYNSPWVGLYFYKGCEKLPLLEIKNSNI